MRTYIFQASREILQHQHGILSFASFFQHQDHEQSSLQRMTLLNLQGLVLKYLHDRCVLL